MQPSLTEYETCTPIGVDGPHDQAFLSKSPREGGINLEQGFHLPNAARGMWFTHQPIPTPDDTSHAEWKRHQLGRALVGELGEKIEMSAAGGGRSVSRAPKAS